MVWLTAAARMQRERRNKQGRSATKVGGAHADRMARTFQTPAYDDTLPVPRARCNQKRPSERNELLYGKHLEYLLEM